ncbi:MAG: segregation/condensation protein A [Clostridia bacterium]|nr:segregation/condensation protein A [Clostridia bacterium]
MSDVSFKTAAFEGPLDLLLHLISKNKVSIYDIPISEITDQYFEYLAECEAMDMELSSEFAVMASQLLYIKSKMLLPVYDEEEEDPRAELVDRLEEYKRYKEISKTLDVMQHAMDDSVFKAPENLDIPKVIVENKMMNPDLLYASFMMIMERNLAKKPLSPQNFSGVIGKKRVSIPHQSRFVMAMLKKQKKVLFEALFENMTTRGEMVATFMAILELIRDSHMIVIEDEGKILCQRCDDFDGYESSSADD